MSEARRRCYERVERCLREAFPGLAQESGEEATLVVPLGPYGIRVTASTVGDDEAVVDVYTWLGRDMEVTPEVAAYLLERNARLRFGSLGVDPDGDIVLALALLPGHVDAATLKQLVELVAGAAQEIEGELGTRFG